MKKIISVLVALGFIWTLTASNFATDKEFKSELENIKNPTRAHEIMTGNYDHMATCSMWIREDLLKAYKDGKLAQWFWEGRFTKEELIQFVSDIKEAINYLRVAAKLLNLPNADKQISIEDLKKTEKYIFKAKKIIMGMMDKPPVIYKLIRKNSKRQAGSGISAGGLLGGPILK